MDKVKAEKELRHYLKQMSVFGQIESRKWKNTAELLLDIGTVMGEANMDDRLARCVTCHRASGGITKWIPT